MKKKIILKSVVTKKLVFELFVFAFLPITAFYVLSIAVFSLNGYAPMYIIRDPAQISNYSSMLGFISNFGNALWICSGSISLFSAWVSIKILKKGNSTLSVVLAFLSFLLAADDFFLIHDRYVNEFICYLFYAIIGISIVVKFYAIIIEKAFLPFVISVSMLATSILIDVLDNRFPMGYDNSQIFEEGFKFLGIGMWLYFNVKIAYLTLLENYVRKI